MQCIALRITHERSDSGREIASRVADKSMYTWFMKGEWNWLSAPYITVSFDLLACLLALAAFMSHSYENKEKKKKKKKKTSTKCVLTTFHSVFLPSFLT